MPLRTLGRRTVAAGEGHPPLDRRGGQAVTSAAPAARSPRPPPSRQRGVSRSPTARRRRRGEQRRRHRAVNGYGADRGFQEPTPGSTTSRSTCSACGNGMAIRTAAGREVGWFDDDFFLYYEDTDLSWRLRAAGWSIRYEPTAVRARALGHQRGVVAALRLPRRPQPAADADQERRRWPLREVLHYPLTTASMLARADHRCAPGRARRCARPDAAACCVLPPAAAHDGGRGAPPPGRPEERAGKWLVTQR